MGITSTPWRASSRVIRVFTRQTPRMTLSEVSQATGMTRATVRRFLLTLVREGYVSPALQPASEGLGARLFGAGLGEHLGSRTTDHERSGGTATRSCFAAVLDHDSVIYVARANSKRRVSVGISIGSRVPAHCVSTGRVLLAALPDGLLHQYLEGDDPDAFYAQHDHLKSAIARGDRRGQAEGWSIVDQELEVGPRWFARFRFAMVGARPSRR